MHGVESCSWQMKSTAVLIVVPALKEYDFVEKAAMCVYWKDRTAVCSTKTGRFSANNIFGRSSLGVEGGLCQNGKGIQIRFCKRREDDNNPPAGDGTGIFVLGGLDEY